MCRNNFRRLVHHTFHCGGGQLLPAPAEFPRSLFSDPVLFSDCWTFELMLFLLPVRKILMKMCYTWSMPIWTCCHVIILRHMTGISGASALFGAQISVWIKASLDSVTSGSAAMWKQAYSTSSRESPPLTWLAYIFSFPLLLPHSQLCAVLPFPGVPLIFPQCVVLKAGPLFPAGGKHGGREGGRRQADFLAASFGSLSVWEKAEETDVMMTEELSIQGTDFSSKTLDVVILLRHKCLNNCVIRLSAFFYLLFLVQLVVFTSVKNREEQSALTFTVHRDLFLYCF